MNAQRSIDTYANWAILAVTIGSSLSIQVLAGSDSGRRPVIALAFLLVCPGMAWIRMVSIESKALKFVLSIAVSMALATLVAEAMLYANHWSEVAGLLWLVGVTLAGIIVEGMIRVSDRADDRHPQE